MVNRRDRSCAADCGRLVRAAIKPNLQIGGFHTGALLLGYRHLETRPKPSCFGQGRRAFERNSVEMTKPSAPTKADLHKMLAEAVRNTQPQPVNSQPEAARNEKSSAKSGSLLRNKRPAQKRTAKIKRVRAPISRKRQPQQSR
jgi:hypothetical protein